MFWKNIWIHKCTKEKHFYYEILDFDAYFFKAKIDFLIEWIIHKFSKSIFLVYLKGRCFSYIRWFFIHFYRFF